MKQLNFQEKYPITVLDVKKSETQYTSAEHIADYFKTCIEETPKVSYITTFDHLAHSREIEGDVSPDIQAAINVVFCFGRKLPNPYVLAVRPRSIGIADMGDRFVVSFMDAPQAPANEAMRAWALALRNS